MMKNNTAVIIPVKEFEKSKLRLSQILNDKQRKEFSFLMLQDVINTLEKVEKVIKIIITTPLKKQINSNDFKKVEIIEDISSDINSAVENAIEYCTDLDVNMILILPSDIPLIKKTDIEALFMIKEKYNAQILIVPSNRNDGTNCILFDSELKIKTDFGRKSFTIHKNKFKSKFRTHIFKSYRIGLDIDYESDLKKLCDYSNIENRISQLYIKKINPKL